MYEKLDVRKIRLTLELRQSGISNSDGTITIPNVLKPYMDNINIIK